MRRLALAATLLTLAACAASTNTANTARGPSAVPNEATGAPSPRDHEVPTRAVDPATGLPLAKGDPAVCKASWQQLNTELVAAANGCAADEDCEEFMTCNAVTRPNAARLWKLRDEAKAACRGLPGSDAEISCVFRPPQCLQGRCQR